MLIELCRDLSAVVRNFRSPLSGPFRDFSAVPETGVFCPGIIIREVWVWKKTKRLGVLKLSGTSSMSSVRCVMQPMLSLGPLASIVLKLLPKGQLLLFVSCSESSWKVFILVRLDSRLETLNSLNVVKFLVDLLMTKFGM